MSVVPAGKHKMDWRRSSASLVHDECVAIATDEEGNKLDDALQTASLCFPVRTADLMFGLCFPQCNQNLYQKNEWEPILEDVVVQVEPVSSLAERVSPMPASSSNVITENVKAVFLEKLFHIVRQDYTYDECEGAREVAKLFDDAKNSAFKFPKIEIKKALHTSARYGQELVPYEILHYYEYQYRRFDQFKAIHIYLHYQSHSLTRTYCSVLPSKWELRELYNQIEVGLDINPYLQNILEKGKFLSYQNIVMAMAAAKEGKQYQRKIVQFLNEYLKQNFCPLLSHIEQRYWLMHRSSEIKWSARTSIIDWWRLCSLAKKGTHEELCEFISVVLQEGKIFYKQDFLDAMKIAEERGNADEIIAFLNHNSKNL